MKEISGTARNVLVLFNAEETPTPIVEGILMLSEPQWKYDEGGALVKNRAMETVRFSATAKGLRALADTFNAWALELEQIGESLVKPD